MKQLIKGIDNSEISNHPDYRDFFLKVNTADVVDMDLRVAVQSYKLSMAIFKTYIKKLDKDKT